MSLVRKPQGFWMESAAIGRLMSLQSDGRQVLIVLDNGRLFKCVDVRDGQSFPSVGQTISLALGHFPVGDGALSLDWIWPNDVSETLRQERDAPAG